MYVYICIYMYIYIVRVEAYNTHRFLLSLLSMVLPFSADKVISTTIMVASVSSTSIDRIMAVCRG